MFEETQIRVSEPTACLPPVHVREGGTVWEVYPFLFRTEDQEPILNKENVGYEWIMPDEIKKDDSAVPLTQKVVSDMLKGLE